MARKRSSFGVTAKKYKSRDAFTQELIERSDKLFKPSQKRKWIKVHGVRTYKDQWQEKLKKYPHEELGKIWRVSLPTPVTGISSDYIDYFVAQYTDELLLFYSGATREEYEATLARFIADTPGFGKMWIGPEKFEALIMDFTHKFNATMKHFNASRPVQDTFPADTRSEHHRHVQWTADDSYDTLFELRKKYGIRPNLVTMSLKQGEFNMSREGFFSLTRINQQMFDGLEETLEFLKDDEMKLANVSQSIRFDTEQKRFGRVEHKVPELVSGSITLKSARLTSDTVREFMAESEFDFINSWHPEESFAWVATAVDRDKKSVFGISSDDSTIHVVPRPGVTFESLLDFYYKVQEKFDSSATISVFSDEPGQ